MDLFHSWGWRWPSICRPSMGIMRAGLASTVAALHTTFFCFFPGWFYLRRDVGVKLIWVAAIGDWLNLVLKWYREFFSRVQWIYRASLKKYFYTTVFLLSFAVGFYVLLKALGVDLLWTLEKAQKLCVRAEWVHMDSTPVASLLRNMDTLIGLGLGVHSLLYTESMKNSSTPYRPGCISVSLLLLQIKDGLMFSSRNQATFYVLSVSKSAAALFILTALVPGGLSWIFPGIATSL